MTKTNFKKIASLLIGILMMVSATTAVADDVMMDVGVQLGAWDQLDNSIQKTFGSDFYMQGTLSAINLDSGLEGRLAIGRYENESHNELDEGDNLRLRVTPLLGSIIYNIKTDFRITPYIGTGVGAYFYSIRNDEFGALESKTKFGPHLLTGIKFNLNDASYLRIEYAHHFLSPELSNNAKNFNQYDLTLGLGFAFDTQQRAPRRTRIAAARKPYTDPLAEQVHSLKAEIETMKEKRTEIQAIIEAFYIRSDFQTTTDLISALDRGLPIEGSEVSVIDPLTREVKIKGMVATIQKTGRNTAVLTLKQNQWQTTLTVARNPLLVTVGGDAVRSITMANVDTSLLITTIKESEEFAKELAKVKYYEGRLGELNQQIKQAQDEFRELSKQYEERRKEIAVNAPNTTIIYEQDFGRRNFGQFNDFHPYQFYNPPYYQYVAPVVINSTPPSPEQREQYIERKKEYIKNLKNR